MAPTIPMARHARIVVTAACPRPGAMKQLER